MITFRSKTVAGFTVDAPFKPIVFPDGAVHIQETEAPRGIFAYQIAIVQGFSHDDLFMLAMWSELCAARDEKTVLVLPYLPGARMDRGVPLGARVYAEFLGERVNPDQTIVLDPHSQTALDFFDGALRNLNIFPVERVIRNEVQDPSRDSKPNQTYQGVIAPDKGAHDRASRAARLMGVPVYQADKTRDFDTGKLSGFEMLDELPAEGKLLIVDDLMDGGGTFKGLVAATGLSKDRVDLWVTHLIGSKGVVGFRETFGTIYTTDSYYTPDSPYYSNEDVGSGFIKITRLTPYLYPEILVH